MEDKKWMTLRRVKRMFADLAKKRLDTLEEINACTTPGMLAGAGAVKDLSSSLGGCSLEQEGENFYIVGADSVRKKLGSGTLKRKIVLSHTRFTGSTTVNIAKQLDNYKELTKDNFFVNSINSNTNGFYFGYSGMVFSYNSSTGILTITAPNVIYEMSVVAVYVE